MRMYHGTTPELGRLFARDGINAHLIYMRCTHGPQDDVPGIFVTPKVSVARRFGLCVLAIEIPEEQLKVPPNLELLGTSLEQALNHHFEPQAFVGARIEPSAVCIFECHENGYSFNPFERDD